MVKCNLSYVDDTKLSSAVDMLEGKDIIQRDIDRLQERALANLEVQQGQVQVPAHGSGQTLVSVKTRG